LLAIAPILAATKSGHGWVLYLIGLVGIAAVAWAIWRSKTESKEFREMEAELGGATDAGKSLDTVGSEA
ncbi:MAG: hypothetical protein P4L84_14210, partial [Isosphaeraceae bacterium]|nr:hypothetical protein [Isosphaeraceae bacterium]